MKFKKGDIVRRKYDMEYNTNLLWEVTKFTEDGICNLVVEITNILDNAVEYCYPEQLEKLEVKS